MTSLKIVKVPNSIKAFSSHPGHGSASKTVHSFEASAAKTRQMFPADRPPQAPKVAHGK